MILHIPIIHPTLDHIEVEHADVRCSLYRDCPRVEVAGETFKPDLMRWTHSRCLDPASWLTMELEARDLLNLSELTEGPYQTVKALARADLKTKVEALCKS